MSKILIGLAFGVSTSIASAVLRWPDLSASIATLTIFGGAWALIAVTTEWFFKWRRASRIST